MDISKQRVGAMPSYDKTNNSMCAQHKHPFIAYATATESLLCKLCMFQSPKTLGQIIPTALLTKSLKTQYDNTYLQFKQSLCDVSEVSEPDNVREVLREEIRRYFIQIRREVAMARRDALDKVSEVWSTREAQADKWNFLPE